MSRANEPPFREQLRDILFKAAGGISNMGDEEIDSILVLFRSALVAELRALHKVHPDERWKVINGRIDALTNNGALSERPSSIPEKADPALYSPAPGYELSKKDAKAKQGVNL